MVTEARMLELARNVLEEALDLPVQVKASGVKASIRNRHQEIGAKMTLDGLTFLVEVKRDGRNTSVARAIEQLRSSQSASPDAAALLVVPHMSDVGADLCERAHVNWIDLDGNASVRAKHRLFVRIEGRRNSIASRLEFRNGTNAFSVKAARIAQALLSDPKRSWTRAELQAASQLDKGFVSKVLSELRKQDYITDETASGRTRNIRVRNPMVLLDAWSEQYRRPEPSAWGLLPARDGYGAASAVSRILEEDGVDYALTGLPAAAAYTGFGNFRRVDVYVSKPLSRMTAKKLHVDPDDRGRNIAIIIDEFAAESGIQDLKSHRYVTPTRVYLDLAKLPERAEDAREEMRNYLEQLWK